ncbi:MAG TPA: 30S ribosomal protein S6 [Polyangia bacterium]|jgi:small subunit ribosomal protein S6|nr:30S ribosomal protein S6 [Polyangia bacterium]
MAEARYGSSRDIPGRKREYETIYILRPDITNEAVGALNTKVRGIIESGQGTLLKVENWGKRRLAYEVQKQMKGMYLFFSYLGPAGLVEEVERNLRLTDAVIRTYSVKIADNVDPATRTSEVTDETFAKAATPRPDEEEIATGQADLRAVFGEDEDGAFDFEEAVFGSDDGGL